VDWFKKLVATKVKEIPDKIPIVFLNEGISKLLNGSFSSK